MSHGLIIAYGLAADDDVLQRLCQELQFDMRISAEGDLETLGAVATCCVIDWNHGRASAACRMLRLSKNCSDVPIVALVSEPWSGQVPAAFGAGADDYVPRSQLDLIGAKFVAVRSRGTVEGEYLLSGKVVVADPDSRRRVSFGRHLRKMGLDVVFAADADGIPRDDVQLIVSHASIVPAAQLGDLLEEFRSAGMVPWVVVGEQEELLAARKATAEGVGFFDIRNDTAQIVSLANKLLVGEGRALRRSVRMEYESPVRLMVQEKERWGYTYNINLGGLYVRTLTPPAIGTEVSVEFAPPFGSERLLVNGPVVWRQQYARSGAYPAGFGVQFEGLAPEAQKAIEHGYSLLLEQAGVEAHKSGEVTVEMGHV